MDLKLAEHFFNSSKNIIKQMANIDLDINSVPQIDEGEIYSNGVASIINFSGKIKGRYLIDIEPSLALAIAQNILGEPCEDTKDRMFLAAISEMNNIIAGDANTVINNTYSLGLRLATPIVLSGSNIIMATPRISSATMICATEYGHIKLNVGFQGGAI